MVTINSVSIQDGTSAWEDRSTNGLDGAEIKSNLKNSGWFNLATGEWDNVGTITSAGSATDAPGATYDITANTAGGTGIYKLDPQIAEPTAAQLNAILDGNKDKWNGTGVAGSPNGVTTTAKNVYSNDASNDVPALLLIPNGSTPQTLYVTVDYFVRTADPQLSTGYSQVKQVVTNMVSLKDLDVNKYYTLVMHLGLTSVKFSAIVADWANSDDASYDEGGTTDGTAEAAEEVWLPSNVIAASTTNESTPELGTSYNENIKASQTTYTVNLTGLAVGQKITPKYDGNITKVEISSTELDNNVAHTMLSTEITGTPATTTLTVTLTANTNVTAAKSLLSILQEASDNTDLTTTSINFVQSGYDIKLTEANGVVTVKNGDNQDVTVTDAKFTVKVYNDAGTELEASGNYNKSGTTISMTNNGTYTVVVTYKDANNATITKTIKTTKTS